jgi:hypothetical protein
VTEIINYDERQFCPEIGEMAWGYVEYLEPLTDADAKNYELIGGHEHGGHQEER